MEVAESNGEGQPEPVWIQLLRDTDLEGSPVRSEGLEVVEATDLSQFLDAGWDGLLFVNDFFFRLLFRVGTDSEFVADWRTHAGGQGDARLLLLQRTTEVCLRWLNRLNRIAEHHRSEGTEPSSAVRIPNASFGSDAPLEFLRSGAIGSEQKFSFLEALTQLAVTHSAISMVRAQAEPENLPDSVDVGALWINSVAVNMMSVGCTAAPALGALDPAILARIERTCSEILLRYETELLQESSAGRASVATDHRTVIVDPQLACDVCAVRTVTTFARAMRSNREEHWNECTKWCSEGHRMLADSPRNQADIPQLDLAGAESWFQPNFGQAWPNCVADAEEIARALVLMTIRNPAKDVLHGMGLPGGLIDIVTKGTAVCFRVPGAAAQPSRARSWMETAFLRAPLVTWLLFPSTGASGLGRFWRDAPYGTLFAEVDEFTGKERRASTASIWDPGTSRMVADQNDGGELAAAVFPDLPESSMRAAAPIVAPLIALWREWGGWENPCPDDERESHSVTL
jgi:hypothetical protein